MNMTISKQNQLASEVVINDFYRDVMYSEILPKDAKKALGIIEKTYNEFSNKS